MTPPGIDNARNPEYYASGGDENTWLSFSKKKYYTNAFIMEDGKVNVVFTSLFPLTYLLWKLLLGLKKRGFGKHKQDLSPFTSFYWHNSDTIFSFIRYNGFGEK